MTSRDFCYWLQVYFEISEVKGCKEKLDIGITSDRAEIIKRHLAMVFKHEIDPSHGDKQMQDALSKLHDPNVTLRC